MKLFSYILWGVAAMVAYWGYLKLEWSYEDADNYIDSKLPKEVFIPYCQISHEYGMWAGDYWKFTFYFKDANRARQSLTATDNAREQVNRAIRQNFAIPQDPKRDRYILDRYIRIQRNYDELERRSNISERRKDFFAYFGGASMIGIVALLVGRSANEHT